MMSNSRQGRPWGLGFVGLLAAAPQASTRNALALGPQSTVLLFGTEGATDPELYRRIVGRAAEEVAAVSGT